MCDVFLANNTFLKHPILGGQSLQSAKELELRGTHWLTQENLSRVDVHWQEIETVVSERGTLYSKVSTYVFGLYAGISEPPPSPELWPSGVSCATEKVETYKMPEWIYTYHNTVLLFMFRSWGDDWFKFHVCSTLRYVYSCVGII